MTLSERLPLSAKPVASALSTRIYVLDTSVLLHDHSAILQFDEHRLALPLTVLEELDTFKVGTDARHFEARACIRLLDRLLADRDATDWQECGNGKGGRLRVLVEDIEDAGQTLRWFQNLTNDHRILASALHLQSEDPTATVTLVTKDINLRLKARALGMPAEDYKNGQVRNPQIGQTGRTTIDNVDPEIIRKLYVNGTSRKITALDPHRRNNHYYVLKSGTSSVLAFHNTGSRTIERVDKEYAYGIKARNAEQAFALHAVMNPEVKLVTISGVAGTGKTLLALAGALEQKNRFDQIILARPVVALSNRDLGYLPGDAEEKINPYMQPLWDNLRFIQSQFGENERKAKALEEMKQDKKITICPLAYIRGRSISNAIFIIDEAQNLTPHEVKTIITRAGDNCKIILTGDVRQIDTPYLDEQSNGLAYVMEKLKGQDLYAHVSLEKGERSALANLANQCL